MPCTPLGRESFCHHAILVLGGGELLKLTMPMSSSEDIRNLDRKLLTRAFNAVKVRHAPTSPVIHLENGHRKAALFLLGPQKTPYGLEVDIGVGSTGWLISFSLLGCFPDNGSSDIEPKPAIIASCMGIFYSVITQSGYQVYGPTCEPGKILDPTIPLEIRYRSRVIETE